MEINDGMLIAISSLIICVAGVTIYSVNCRRRVEVREVQDWVETKTPHQI